MGITYLYHLRLCLCVPLDQSMLRAQGSSAGIVQAGSSVFFHQRKPGGGWEWYASRSHL